MSIPLPRRRPSARKSAARRASMPSFRPSTDLLEQRTLLAGGPLTVVITELNTSPLEQVTIVDNQAGDANPTTSVIDYSTPAASPFADFSIAGLELSSNRTTSTTFATLSQSGTIIRTSASGGNQTLQIQVGDSSYLYPATNSMLYSSADATYTNGVAGDTSQFQSFYNTTPSPVVPLAYVSGNPTSVSGNATPTTISGSAPFNLSNTFITTLAPSVLGSPAGDTSTSFQSTGTSAVTGVNAAIAGNVYLDKNLNGVLDASDTPIGSVTVTLAGTNANGVAVNATTQTAANGTYSFTNLTTGVYAVTETQPSGYIPAKVTPGVPVDGMVNGISIQQVTITGGQSLVHYDFGETLPVSIIGHDYLVPNTTPASSLTTATTGAPIAGTPITVSGTDVFGNPVSKTITTAADGSYSFTGLAPSNSAGYTVTEVPPVAYKHLGQASSTAGAISTTQPTTDGFSSIVLATPGSSSVDNFYEIAGSIAGTVYIDTLGSGLFGPNNAPPAGASPPYTPESGVMVELLTGPGGTVLSTATVGSSGTFLFPNLVAGTYFVQEIVPTGYIQTGPTSFTYTVPLAAGQAVVNDNFSNYAPATPCGISGESVLVVQPNGTKNTYSSLGGNTQEGDTVTVTFNTTMAETVTLVSYNATSNFDLTKQTVYQVDTEALQPGKHSLTVTIPDNYYQIDLVCGGAIYTFNPAANNTYHDENRFIDSDNGGNQVPGVSSLSGTVYIDANGNDSFGAGDSGLGGVFLKLTGTTTTGVSVSASAISATTGNVGSYSFTGLLPGTYTITETQPGGYFAETANFGSVGGSAAVGSVATIALNSNTAAVGYNFGEIGTLISGTAYVDATGVGLTTANLPPSGSGDTPESGVVINLYNTSGAIVATTTTASNGTYSFPGQPLGTYYIAEVVPANTSQTGPNALYYMVTTTSAAPTSTNDNFSNYMNCSLAGVSGIYYTIYTPCGSSYNVSDLRGNTAQGDIVVANFTVAANTSVTLSLVAYEAPTSSYSSSNAYQQVITSDSTGTFGPGCHSIWVAEPNSYYQVDFVCGTPLAQLEANGSHVDYNFENRLISADNGGSQAYAPSSLSGTVFSDANKNGSYGWGDSGLSKVTLTLTGTTGTGASVTATTTTDGNGNYSFGNLAPGFYTITEATPSGYSAETSNVGWVGGSSGAGSTSWIGLNSNIAAGGYNFGNVRSGWSQLAAGSTSLAGQGVGELIGSTLLHAGTLDVGVSLPQGPNAAAEQAAIARAIRSLDAQLAPLGVNLVEVTGAAAASAPVHITFASTSSIGGVAQGVLGDYSADGDITLIAGWDWYFGTGSAPIASGQYDLQTVVTHELGHALGLGENSDAASAMDLYLKPGQVRHALTATDLAAVGQELHVGLATTVTASTSTVVPLTVAQATSPAQAVSLGSRVNAPAAALRFASSPLARVTSAQAEQALDRVLDDLFGTAGM